MKDAIKNISKNRKNKTLDSEEYSYDMFVFSFNGSKHIEKQESQ